MSSATISAITDKGIPELKQWQQRPLSTIKSAEILGLYLSENQGANVWLSVLTDLQNCGMDDILIACVDGLTRFPEAINSIYPDTEVQLCVIHQIRNSIKYGSSKHHKAFMADLKPVYRAVSKEAAETALDELEAKWGQQYPVVLQSWRRKWDNPSHYFRYPAAIRKVIYTTNAIEWGHRQFRKLTETKGVFLNENSLLKLLYPGLNERARKMDNADPELEFDIVPVGDLF